VSVLVEFCRFMELFIARASDWRRAKAARFAADRSRFSCSSLLWSGAGVGEGIVVMWGRGQILGN